MKTKPRIYISVPDNKTLNDRRISLKQGIIRSIAAADFEPVGFEPEQFGVKGLSTGLVGWDFAKARSLMRRCDGAVVLGLARTFVSRIDFNQYHSLLQGLTQNQVQAVMELVISGSKDMAAGASRLSVSIIEGLLGSDTPFRRACQGIQRAEDNYARANGSNIDPYPTPYNHFEGALAIAQEIPLLVLAEENMDKRGILFDGGGIKIPRIPANADQRWVKSPAYQGPFAGWKALVQARRDVFLGYCSKADKTATAIRDQLETKGYSVLDWARDFAKAGPTILEEMSRAASTCRCAIFLFTTDDPLEGEATKRAVPRDNVLVEAGYFVQARGKERVAIIREKGVKMPADFGGVIYVSLENRRSLKSIHDSLSSFLDRAIAWTTA